MKKIEILEALDDLAYNTIMSIDLEKAGSGDVHYAGYAKGLSQMARDVRSMVRMIDPKLDSKIANRVVDELG